MMKNTMTIDMDNAINIGDMIATEICDEQIDTAGGVVEKEIITSIKGRQITVKVCIKRK